MMLTNEQLTYCIQQLYPGTQNGVDYWIGHPIGNDGKQSGGAFITLWQRVDLRQPVPEEFPHLWQQYQDSFTSMQAEREVRWRRDEFLREADALVEKYADTGNTNLEQAARTYRSALREVPQQSGFPLNVQWPLPPNERER